MAETFFIFPFLLAILLQTERNVGGGKNKAPKIQKNNIKRSIICIRKLTQDLNKTHQFCWFCLLFFLLITYFKFIHHLVYHCYNKHQAKDFQPMQEPTRSNLNLQMNVWINCFLIKYYVIAKEFLSPNKQEQFFCSAYYCQKKKKMIVSFFPLKIFPLLSVNHRFDVNH